jgi:hypothetical protein
MLKNRRVFYKKYTHFIHRCLYSNPQNMCFVHIIPVDNVDKPVHNLILAFFSMWTTYPEGVTPTKLCRVSE